MLKKSTLSMSREEHHDNANEEDGAEDYTCCSRAAFCFPGLRNIILTEPILKWFKLTWASVFWMITVTGMVLMSWSALFFLLGDTMLFGGSCFGFFILVLFSYFLGWSLAYIPYINLPPVFGMLLAGIIVRNAEFYNIRQELGSGVMGKIRTFCITFIMLRAGLELTITPLKKYPVFVTILALVPCTVEMAAVATCTVYMLDYPWKWALMTGTIIACMSPVVTINCLLALAERGYGEDKGIASLLCAASSIDDIHILSLFSIFYAIVFSESELTDWWSYIPPGIPDLILGGSSGLLLGIFLTFFPHRTHRHVTSYRLFGLVVGSVMCTASTSKLKITGGPYLAIIIMSIIASKGWQLLSISYDTRLFRKATYFFWHFTQPVLGAVIGADIHFKHWTMSKFGLYCACILVGILTRCSVVVLSTIKTGFSWKERIFIALAWIPKGTLQAALAPMAYERAIAEVPEHYELAIDVVRLSVLTIIFLAPLGSIAMSVGGPLLLNKATIEDREKQRRLSYLRLRCLQPVGNRQLEA